ncbi:MAG: FKBP-type peptidyl-prolyl cis-trans isomerase [Paramuribaculum sp.]|nr:FKBP-type peptidyl-prolyl cis-trans isomerase [Paramuribaculum sp.]
MNKAKLLFVLPALSIIAASCSSDNDDTWSKYAQWRDTNNAWFEQEKYRTNDDGTPFYEVLSPSWYPGSQVLIHYYNDRALTQNNLVPYVTSTVSVKYVGYYYNGEIFDSSFANTDSAIVVKPTGTIAGWQIALTNMHVGDSVDVVIPADQAYGASVTSGVNPYSVLRFSMKLKDIPEYQLP